MSTRKVLDFTVTDLLRGGDDVRSIFAADDPDGLWDEVDRWPRHRLTAALVAAVGVTSATNPDETVDGHGHHSSVAGHRPVGQDPTRTPPDGH